MTFENDGSEVFTENVITTTMNGARSVFASDLDGDGDNDIMSASADDDKVAWYENDGTGTFALHVITTGAQNASSVYSADVNGDGNADVLDIVQIVNLILGGRVDDASSAKLIKVMMQ